MILERNKYKKISKYKLIAYQANLPNWNIRKPIGYGNLEKEYVTWYLASRELICVPKPVNIALFLIIFQKIQKSYSHITCVIVFSAEELVQMSSLVTPNKIGGAQPKYSSTSATRR